LHFRRPNAHFTCSRLLSFQFSDESVATPRNGLNVAGALEGVVKYVAKLLYRSIQAIVRIHEGTNRPKLVFQFFAGDHFSLSFQQKQ
jgi:hypothetical protein